MKKRTRLVSLILLGVILIGCSILLFTKRFLLPEMNFNGRTIFYEGRKYTVNPYIELDSLKSGKEVGRTDSGFMIQSIPGYSPKQWMTICEGHETACAVYIEKSVGHLGLHEFSPDEMVVEERPGKQKPATIRDQKLIDQLVELVTKEASTRFPKDYQVKKAIQIRLKSSRFPNLNYVLMYLEDQSGRRYLRGEKLVEIKSNPDVIKTITS